VRIPDPLFPVINQVMRLLLNSPLHALMSGSVMVVYYTGRKTNRPRWTPVRYIRRDDGTVACLTGRETGWWPNFLEPRTVELQIAGRRVTARALARRENSPDKEAVLRAILARFPNDAPYHGIAVRGDRATDADIAIGLSRDVLVTFDP